ncbi:MAG: glycosyltransferase family 2 protein [Ruminococcus sp.]|nr:glycosyltransferase family 2 protein [Ruminococcus sp.]
MKTAAIVSVIVASHRRDDELKRALSSLGGQTFRGFEIIVVDDNANEEYNERVEKNVNEFKQNNSDISITLIKNEKNLGSAHTRNIGITHASGKYITFLDDDDEYLPEKLERQLAFMEENRLDYSVTDLDLYYDDGKLYEKKRRPYLRGADNDELFRCHFMHHITGTDTMMFTAEYINKIKGFEHIDVGDEFYLIQRAIEGGGKFGYLERSDVKAYVHRGNGGLSSGEGKIKGENVLFAHKKKYFDRFDGKSRRQIKMRHYAVIAFANLRIKNYGGFVCNGVHAIVCSPIQGLRLLRSVG